MRPFSKLHEWHNVFVVLSSYALSKGGIGNDAVLIYRVLFSQSCLHYLPTKNLCFLLPNNIESSSCGVDGREETVA